MKNAFYLLFLLFPFVSEAQIENTWLKKNDFTGHKRTRAAGFSIGSHGYLCGGIDTAEVVLKDLWQYDPTLDVWAQKADLPGPVRRNAVAFTIQDKGYVGTGIDSVLASNGDKLSDFYQYDATANSWTQKADFPAFGGAGLYFATGFAIDSKGYICGGKRGPNQYSDQLWEYKPSNDTWTQRTSFPGGVRYQLCSFVIGFDGFVGLGTDQDVYRKDLWKYSAGTNQWSQCADLPGNERASASTFSIGLRGFVCMGTNGGYLLDTWEFNPYSDSWAIRAPFGGSERKNAVSFVVNDKAYVGTGSGFSGKKGSFHEYTPYENVFLETNELDPIDFTIYPNPVKDKLVVNFENAAVKKVEMISAFGQVVLKSEIQSHQELNIDCSVIQPGVYFLNLKSEQGGQLGSKKIIVL